MSDPLTEDVARLTCNHAFHRRCLFGLLTSPVLGAASMLRCPMCRATIDRFDAKGIGCDVSPKRLTLAQDRCEALRQLASGEATSAGRPPSSSSPISTVARLVQRCAETEAMDGFLYNSTVLALDRAMFHRTGLARALDTQLRAPRNQLFDPLEFVRTSLACHLEVLMRTASGMLDP